MTRQAISAICANYRAGDPDPREPGTCMQVQFKEFALDFDNFVVPQEALPQAEGELLRSMQHLRLAAQVPYPTYLGHAPTRRTYYSRLSTHYSRRTTHDSRLTTHESLSLTHCKDLRLDMTDLLLTAYLLTLYY